MNPNIVSHFDEQWKNPPSPFNPLYDPEARKRFDRVAQSMESDGFYTNHTLQECADEFNRRYHQKCWEEVNDN